jgi:hypothetical protein
MDGLEERVLKGNLSPKRTVGKTHKRHYLDTFH